MWPRSPSRDSVRCHAGAACGGMAADRQYKPLPSEPFSVTYLIFRRICAPLMATTLLWAGAALAQAPQQSVPAGNLSPGQVEQVERIIRDYLLRNPELILEAVENLEQKR